jgi:hypothetical protein
VGHEKVNRGGTSPVYSVPGVTSVLAPTAGGVGTARHPPAVSKRSWNVEHYEYYVSKGDIVALARLMVGDMPGTLFKRLMGYLEEESDRTKFLELFLEVAWTLYDIDPGQKPFFVLALRLLKEEYKRLDKPWLLRDPDTI